MSIACLISVRSSSARLPFKALLPFGLYNTLLEHNIARLRHFGFEPIVCTSNSAVDNVVENVAKSAGAKVFRGSLNDKLGRWLGTCLEYGLDHFVTADNDDPFSCPNLIRDAYHALIEGADFVPLPDVQPNYGYYEGCVGYGISSKILSKTYESLNSTENTEHAWSFINDYGNKVISTHKLDLTQRSVPIRLTIDYRRDYEVANAVASSLGHFATRDEICAWFNSEGQNWAVHNWAQHKYYMENLGQN